MNTLSELVGVNAHISVQTMTDLVTGLLEVGFPGSHVRASALASALREIGFHYLEDLVRADRFGTLLHVTAGARCTMLLQLG